MPLTGENMMQTQHYFQNRHFFYSKGYYLGLAQYHEQECYWNQNIADMPGGDVETNRLYENAARRAAERASWYYAAARSAKW